MTEQKKCFHTECKNIATEFFPFYMPDYGVCKRHLKWFKKAIGFEP